MSVATHTPGPWTAVTMNDGSRNLFGPNKEFVCQFGHVEGQPMDQIEGNGRLIAACPAMLAELRETANWLDERAKAMREIASRRMPGGVAESLRADAARFEGRAALIRQTILKATQGA